MKSRILDFLAPAKPERKPGFSGILFYIFFMYYVYMLLSKRDGQLYIGSTPDLKKRVEKHNRGFVLSTKNRLPLVLIYYEAYLLSHDAKHREKFLKGGKVRTELKIQLKSCFEKMNYRFR